MKCYYPIDSAGNRIGFKTPEACVYDASGTSLTTKLAQINSNKQDKFITSPFQLSSINSKVGATCHGYQFGSLYFLHIYGSAALTQNESTEAFKFPFTGTPTFTGECTIGSHVVSEFNTAQANCIICLNSDITQTAWLNGITICVF